MVGWEGTMQKYLDVLNHIVWGAPALVLILGVGIYLTIYTGFAQFRLFPRSVRMFFSRLAGRKGSKGVSSMQALCTALAATVGTGNLVGVAGAICLGGPGSIFWMWICGFLGMVTKYAEATLAVRYRVRKNGEHFAGPMYMIRGGLDSRWHWLGTVYCFFGVIAAFGVGNATQINAVIVSVNQTIEKIGIRPSWQGNLLMGIGLGILIGILFSGGARRIGKCAEFLVPFVSCGYLVLCMGALVTRISVIPDAFAAIFRGAFDSRAVTGGIIGSAFSTLRVGVSRGVFTNEAGMGTASIAHGGADVMHPSEQGLMGIMEVFLDTILICTMTALVILTSGVNIPYGTDAGGILTVAAFVQVYGDWVTLFLALALCCFALATVMGWGLYGARCAQYLFGDGAWKYFTLLQSGMVVLAAVMQTGVLWSLAETVNGLMAIPNLIVLAALSPELKRLTCEYKKFYG